MESMRASTTDDNAAFADSDKSNVKIYFLTVPYVKKRNAVYLGRVIDRENNVFFNKERGVFTYDVIT